MDGRLRAVSPYERIATADPRNFQPCCPDAELLAVDHASIGAENAACKPLRVGQRAPGIRLVERIGKRQGVVLLSAALAGPGDAHHVQPG
jgi:hypothetical protein